MIEKWLSASSIAKLLGQANRTIQLRAARESWSYRTFPGNGGPRPCYHLADLPEDVQAAYAVSLKTTLEALRNELKPLPKAPVQHVVDGYKGYGSAAKDLKQEKALSETDREIASLRAQILQVYGELGMKAAEFARAYSSGLIATDIRAGLIKLSPRDASLSQTKLYGWLERYSQGGVFALAHQYKDRGGVGASLSPEVKNLLEYLYLDTNRPGVADVVRHIQKVYGHEEVSEITARRYLMSLPKAVQLVWREGIRALDKVNPSVIRDYTLYKPMEVIVGDYMTQDFMLRYKDKVCRAKVCAFMDMRTRAIVGWCLRLTADSIGVAMALQKCFDRFGLPDTIYFDNGREFKNQFLCGGAWENRKSAVDTEDLIRNIGVVVDAGVKIVFAKPYNAKAKPIERFWRTLHEQFDKWMITYTGSNTADSPDEAKVYRQNIKKMKQEDFEQIPEFAAVERMLNHFFEYYNNEHEHTGQGMDSKPPMQVWAENAVPKREVPAELKPYLFTYKYTRVVSKDGIQVNSGLYYAQEVIQYLGTKVQIKVPLDRDDVVYVFSLTGEHLFDAVYRDDGTTTAEKNEAVGKRRKANKAFIKSYNAGKKELDEHDFQTVAEAWAREHPDMIPRSELKVVNGSPLILDEGNSAPRLTLVKMDELTDKPRRKLKGIFDD